VSGKHRAPVEHNTVRNVTAVATGVAILSTPTSAIAAASVPNEAFNLIAECETGGRNVMNYINDSTHTASGPWQITNTTWRAYGGTEFAPTAIQATIAEQLVVAQRIQAARPGFQDWNESKHCWGSRMPAALAGKDVTAVNVAGGQSATPPPVVTPAPAPAPAPVPASALSYTVRAGDVLERIAASTGYTVAQLASWNGLADPDRILAGQVLRLEPGEAPAKTGDTVTVQTGDELREIAAEYGTTVRDLAAINHLDNPDFILPGQVLSLGGQGVATPDAVHGVVSGANRWQPQVARSVTEIADRFGIATVSTRNGHQPAPDRAADFMTGTDYAKQKAMLSWLIENRTRLGIEYVISQQRIYGEWTNWKPQVMEDRGGPTANHFDHNHVAFLSGFTYAAATGATAQAPNPAGDTRTVTVQPGDTLTKLFGAATWRDEYEANRGVIGPNPNALQIGQVLLVDADGTTNLLGARPNVP
jgi:LysM repeat protein